MSVIKTDAHGLKRRRTRARPWQQAEQLETDSAHVDCVRAHAVEALAARTPLAAFLQPRNGDRALRLHACSIGLNCRDQAACVASPTAPRDRPSYPATQSSRWRQRVKRPTPGDVPSAVELGGHLRMPTTTHRPPRAIDVAVERQRQHTSRCSSSAEALRLYLKQSATKRLRAGRAVALGIATGYPLTTSVDPDSADSKSLGSAAGKRRRLGGVACRAGT